MYSDYLAFEVLSTDNQHYRMTIRTVTINNNKCTTASREKKISKFGLLNRNPQ